MSDITNRTDFVETWLAEMPQGLGNFETFDMIEYNIKDRLKHGSQPIEVNQTTKKIVGQQVMYYWIEKNNTILLGTELQIKPQGLVVSVTGKNPQVRGKEPYASDLYITIINDNNKSLRLISDISLSDEGFSLWQRLLNQGHKISIYDREKPGKSFKTIESIDELKKYFGYDDTGFERYQFVLSESGEMLAETRSYFNTRRLRELVPGLL